MDTDTSEINDLGDFENTKSEFSDMYEKNLRG